MTSVPSVYKLHRTNIQHSLLIIQTCFKEINNSLTLVNVYINLFIKTNSNFRVRRALSRTSRVPERVDEIWKRKVNNSDAECGRNFGDNQSCQHFRGESPHQSTDGTVKIFPSVDDP